MIQKECSKHFVLAQASYTLQAMSVTKMSPERKEALRMIMTLVQTFDLSVIIYAPKLFFFTLKQNIHCFLLALNK